jgi:hypothetical protein
MGRSITDGNRTKLRIIKYPSDRLELNCLRFVDESREISDRNKYVKRLQEKRHKYNLFRSEDDIY